METVFTPIKIGDVEVPNRIVFPAMELNLASTEGTPTKLYLRVYSKPAAGGAGLVFGGPAYPHISGRGSPYMLSLDRDDTVAEISRVATEISKYGSVPAIQLLHSGRYTSSLITGGKGPVAPSPIPAPILARETPRELTRSGIEEIVNAYGKAAERAAKAGFKIVEIHAGMGYLPAEFLSRRTNRRTDDYGGSLENRARFLIEVVEECIRRARVPVTVRYSLVDFLEDGIPFNDNVKVLRWLEDIGLAAVNAVFGWHESRVPLTTRDVPPAAFAQYTGRLKDVLGIPVIYGTRVKNLRIAEKLVREKLADMVSLGRPLLADPRAPVKHRRGEPVRPCIACNRCLSQVIQGKTVSCTVNPTLLTLDEHKKRRKRMEVAVIGGGPAGLEAALTLSKGGHSVVLIEAEEELGGMLRYARITPFNAELGELIDYYVEEMERLGVEIKLGEYVRRPEKLAREYDLVVLATGPSLSLEWVEGSEYVLPWRSAFERETSGSDIIVLGGGHVGLSIAEYLASRGNRVTVADVEKPGATVEKAARWTVLMRLRRIGVKLVAPASKIRVLDHNTVEVHMQTSTEVLTADYIIGAKNFTPREETSKYAKLNNVIVVGNALSAPRGSMLLQAIHSAHNISKSVS